jgi:hypothetical protein
MSHHYLTTQDLENLSPITPTPLKAEHPPSPEARLATCRICNIDVARVRVFS